MTIYSGTDKDDNDDDNDSTPSPSDDPLDDTPSLPTTSLINDDEKDIQ